MAIEKYHNPKYETRTGIANDVPEATGDRYYAQDIFRDLRYHQDLTGKSISDIQGLIPVHISGGIVTQGAGQSLDITAGYGYAKFLVDIVDDFAALPPTVTTAYLDAMRIAWTAKNDMNASDADCTTYSVTDDGATINYVKVKYVEADSSNTRSRAKSSGSYSYEVNPHFEFIIDSNAPSVNDDELCIATFTSSGGTYTITNGYTSHQLTYKSLQSIVDEINNLDTYMGTSTYTGAKAYRRQITKDNGGFYGNVIWGNGSTVYIRPKQSAQGAFVGVILSTGEYIESTSIITASLSSNRLNGGIAIQNNAWYTLIGYKTSGGVLAFGFSWMPITTFSESNPTTDLTLTQVDSKDIGLCFPEEAELVVFDSSTKFETPIFYYGGSYSASGELYTSSRTSTVLTLNKSLSISSLAGSKLVYQVSGFKPIDYSTGNVTSLIGSNGWSDTGIRIRTNGSGNILPFIIVDGKFYFANGIGSADADRSTGLGHYLISSASYVEYRETYIPPDKSVIISYIYGNNWALSERNYYDTYGVLTHCFGAAGALETLRTERNCLHAISSMKYTISSLGTATLGYVI